MVHSGGTPLDMEVSQTSCWPELPDYIAYSQRSYTTKTSPSPSGTPRVLGSSVTRRYRRKTACTTCRDRRVKCNRERPSCTQCTKGGRSCKYLNSETPEFEFIEVKVSKNPVIKSPSPGMSNSMIERKFEFKEQAIGRLEVDRSQVPLSHLPSMIPPNFVGAQFHEPVKNVSITLKFHP